MSAAKTKTRRTARPERGAVARDSNAGARLGASSGAYPGAHLLFVPDWRNPRFFLWGDDAGESPLSVHGDPATHPVIDRTSSDRLLSVREAPGYALPLLDATRALAALPADELSKLAASTAVWSLAAKLLLDLAARERAAPRVVTVDESTQARWVAALSLPSDSDRVMALAKSFPFAAHAVPVTTQTSNGKQPSKAPLFAWSADALLRAYLDMGIDALLRFAVTTQANGARKSAARKHDDASWPLRLSTALVQASSTTDCAHFAAQGFAERGLLEELQAWTQPALGAAAGLPRACFRFELPDADTADDTVHESFALHYFLQAADDPNVLVSAADVFADAPSLASLHCDARSAEEQLLKSLAGAGRIFAPIELSLRQARPVGVELKADAAWQFIDAAAPALTEAGMSVILPEQLTRKGRRRLRMRMRVGAATQSVRDETRDGLQSDLLGFRWEAEIDGRSVGVDDLAELAELKAPLVKFRGQWVAVDRDELAQAQQLLKKGGGTMNRAQALAAALAGTVGAAVDEQKAHALPIEVAADGDLSQLLAQLTDRAAHEDVPVPTALNGQLRPYQQRGLAWLAMMSRLQLGACLADDMGLGKTIQLLAYLLHRRERGSQENKETDEGPVLLVCPTSVLGNWEREISRFAPSIPVHPHYGPERARDVASIRALPPGAIVLTSYALLRRDAPLLTEVQWSVAVLDEAQNIKNAASRTARTARALQAESRVALTGTPVENRLTELWSIGEFLNPGMLGSFEGFRREIAIPIERFGRDDVAERLQHIVRPLILRRVKNDPAIIQDLPPKQEMTVYCTLTHEQASLYRAALESALEEIEGADGIERRGRVLALITALKQICNHPAQYLHEAGPLGGRSGKLERLREMLEETLAAGDRVLVFTQYREMGERLVRDLKRHFGNTVQYLHGGTPRTTREEMIDRFQAEGRGPRIFVLSLKAGGTGLNLTAATHVFHYDRWWNPAVEDQATDRAYRIGQARRVQVHKFLCAGTIEERVAQLLESKRDLAARIVGEGEQWITELDNEQLRQLFSLAPNAIAGADQVEDDASDDRIAARAANSRRERKRATRELV